MKTNYRLLMGGTALFVSLFLNFRYAYGGYGASEALSPGSSLRAAAADKDSDSDTESTCGTANNGEPYSCNSKIEIENGVMSCPYYVAEYKFSLDKSIDIEYEGKYIRGELITVKEDHEYKDWKDVCVLKSLDYSKVTKDHVEVGKKWNNFVVIRTEYVAGTFSRVKCSEGGYDKCLERIDIHCAGADESSYFINKK